MPDPVEDLSNVPASVMKQQKDADAKIEAAKKELENPTTTQPENQLNTVPDQSVPDPAKPVIETPAAPAAPAISDGTTDDGQWEHKYSVLQGKYNSEVDNFRSTIVDMQAQMDRQNTIIEGLNSKQFDAPKANELGDDLDPEDFSGWGDEMKVMVKQVNSLKAIINDQSQVIAGYNKGGQPNADSDGLQTRVESLESEVNDNRANAYLKFLDETIKGDWRVLNKDVNFNAWIDQQDPLSLQPRRSTLTNAASQLRGDQVASIFNLYISSNGKSSVNIADELPNGGGNGGFDDSNSNSNEVTQADVTKAQNDFVQGKITEEEFDKIYSQFQATLRRQSKS
jgi:hypothetical protein